MGIPCSAFFMSRKKYELGTTPTRNKLNKPPAIPLYGNDDSPTKIHFFFIQTS